MANLVGWVMNGIVALLLFAIAAILKDPVRLLVTGERARGVVVGMEVRAGSDSSGAGGLRSPLVEFVTPTGERVTVRGRSYSPRPSAREGDAVTVAYSPSQPHDARLLLLGELGMVGVLLGFVGFVTLLWISVILVSKDPAFGDPFHLLSAIVVRFRLNPVRFPVLFVLSAAILTSGPATYVFAKRALDLRSNGVKAVGHVIGLPRETSTLNDDTRAIGVYPMIAYVDPAGTEHVIRGSLAKPLSRLRTGDVVEVIYLARSPHRGVVNAWYELYPAPLFFGFTALTLLVLLGLVLRRAVRP